eukprot:408134-Pleurochrysis_carterae.AAC.1
MPPVHNAALMARMREKNIDLCWLFRFLHGFAFLYWDLRQSVRSNQSEAIDSVWPITLAPSTSAGVSPKPHGQPLGLPGSNVGYDMPIEKENLAISFNVTNAPRESSPSMCGSSISWGPSHAPLSTSFSPTA